MRVHITNRYGLCGTAGKAQRMTADIAKRFLGYNELGIYVHKMEWDSPEMLRSRLDGIIASVSHGDIVIFQLPTWNGYYFDDALVRQLSIYSGLKKIFFIHDIEPMMYGTESEFLGRSIELYNRADVIILPSQRMADYLRERGLKVEKIVIQRMWDESLSIDTSITPKFNKVIQFAGDVTTPKFSFAQEWPYETVRLAVTAEKGDWAAEKNIDFLGWFNNDNLLAAALRRTGGFGLLWTEEPVCYKYMTCNACCKLSTYIGAGVPVIVSNSIPEADMIRRKELGLTVDSLAEAVKAIEEMTEERYDRMVRNTAEFGKLIRGGYFIRKALINAVFQLLYD